MTQDSAGVWQAIESAPRDGTEVLVAVPSFGTGPLCGGIARYDENGWSGPGWFEQMEPIHTPVFWMPFPALPNPPEGV